MTNREKIDLLKKELTRVGNEIEKTGKEKELKERAKNIAINPPEKFIPEVLELDPLRDEKICDYYIYLFANYESLKSKELEEKNISDTAQQKWLDSKNQPANENEIKKFIKRIAEKIAVSGVTAGIIWLGKVIIENWPFGYRYIEERNKE